MEVFCPQSDATTSGYESTGLRLPAGEIVESTIFETLDAET
jgi:hypothetical protein